MRGSPKAHQLNIRASAAQKAKLARAARLQNMNLSQFVLSRSLEAADEVIAQQMLVRLPSSDYDSFVARLDEQPREIPELRRLFQDPSVFEQ